MTQTLPLRVSYTFDVLEDFKPEIVYFIANYFAYAEFCVVTFVTVKVLT